VINLTSKKQPRPRQGLKSPHQVVFSGKRRRSTTVAHLPYIGRETKRQELSKYGSEDIAGNTPTIRSPERLIEATATPIARLSIGGVETHLADAVGASPPLQALASLATPGGSVPVPDTKPYPWRVTAALIIRIPNSNQAFTGTGWLIGPRAIVTAGHCVFPRGPVFTGFAAQIEVHIGLNGVGNDPVCPPAIASHFACSQGWHQSGDPAYDYGVVVLDESLGDGVGWLGASVLTDNEILGSVANLSAYPSNSPNPSVPNGKQWYVSGQPGQVDNSFIYYNFGLLPGESGGALYRNVLGESYAMGIHIASQGNLGRSVRITDQVAQNLHTWASIK
jgi:glutamyl endopeptidase